MARFSFGVWDSTSSTYLAGESVEIKDALGGTVLASTVDIGVGLLVSPNGDGAYYCDDIPAQDLWVYIDGAIQQELAGVPWDDGDAAAHIANVTTSVHGSGGQVTGQTDVDDLSIEYSGGYRVKALGIVEAMIAALAVTAGKIASNAVTTVKIINDAVTTAKILDANVTGAKLASAVAGDGLTQNGSGNLDLDLSVAAGEVDLEFNGSNALRLKKSLSSEVYLSESMDLGQMLSVIDNRMRQNAEIIGSEGKFYLSLWRGLNDPAAPSAVDLTYTRTFSNAAYYNRLYIPLFKVPEMRQIVYYFSVQTAVPDDGYMRVRAGGLSQESDAIILADEYAIYIDITSLANFETHDIYIDGKVATASMVIEAESLIVRNDTTALAGDTSYPASKPVE